MKEEQNGDLNELQRNEEPVTSETKERTDGMIPGADPEEEALLEEFRATIAKVKEEIGGVIVGQEGVVDTILTALVVGGHVLLEGVPGLGKTLMVKTLSEVLSMDFSRIQFTPDLMPSDITGTNMLVETGGQRVFEFRKGPVFANIVLADEINRATPKTQSALLEAMQEASVTVFGQNHRLAQPFLVMATENPLELEGTYPLPEAQLDRFMFKVNVEYPSLDELTSILRRTTEGRTSHAKAILDGDTLIRMRDLILRLPVSVPVYNYTSQLVLATHPSTPEATDMVKKYVRFGVSPRGAQAIIVGGKVLAARNGRHYVGYSDVNNIAYVSLRHRIILNFQADADGVTADDVITDVLGHMKKRGEKRFGRVV